MKKLLYILIIGIFLCTFAKSDKVLEQGLAIRNILWAFLTLVIFFAFSWRATEKAVVISSPIFYVYLGFVLITVLSLTKAINVSEGYYEVGRVVVSLVFLYVISMILYKPENKDKLVKSLIVLALVVGIYGVYEYFTIPSCRRVGFMSNRNLWSAAYMMLIPFCLMGLKFSKKWRYLCVLTGTLIIFNIIMLMTRSVWLSLVVGSVMSLIVFRKIPKFKYMSGFKIL